MKGYVSLVALVLAFAPALLAPGLAFAQPAPAPADPPAPVIGGAGAAPAPAVGPPVVAPAPDKPAAPPTPPKEEAPEPLIWRGTTFTWTNAVTTTTLGVGRDNIGSEDDFYGMDWVLAPQLYVLDLPSDKIILAAEAGIALEITDSGTTTTRKEPQFRDTHLSVGYNRNIWTSEDKEWATKGSLRTRAIFPTSPVSQGQGRYLTTTFGITLSQQIRLLGNAADGLNNLNVVAGFTYSHLFARSYSATNPDLERTRQSASGQNILSDQLTTSSLDIDRIIPSITFILPIYKDLSITTGWRLIGRFKHDFDSGGCDVDQPGIGGCLDVDANEGDEGPITYVTNSSFDVAITQPIYDVVSLTLGYNNETLTLGEDGKSRNVFYSPGAQFYIDLGVNLDAIYAKASGREKFELPPGPRSSVTAASNAGGMPSF